MGACAGKKKPDRSIAYEPKSNSSKKQKSKTKDKNSQSNLSPPPPPETLPIKNGSIVHDNRTPSVEEATVDPNIQASIDEQRDITTVITKTLPGHVVSVTGSELEGELATLIYGHPERDYAENPVLPTTIRSSEV